jgi:hypothetical protein
MWWCATCVVPVGEVEGGTLIAGLTYSDLLVECPEFPYDEEAKSYPTAVIPMLLYTSDVLPYGSKLHWLQWPVRRRRLFIGWGLWGGFS